MIETSVIRMALCALSPLYITLNRRSVLYLLIAGRHCTYISLLIITLTILRPEGGGGGGKHHFFIFHICDRAAEDKQVEKNGSKSDCAFLRYCM